LNSFFVRRLFDLAIIAAVGLCSASIGYELLDGRRLNTFGEDLPPAVMLACGQGLVDPVAPSPAFQAFRKQERLSLSCAEAAGDGRMQPPNLDIVSTRYEVRSIALALRVFGISWRTLHGGVAVVFALSMSLAYALLRLAVGRTLAVVGIAALLFSNHTLSVALYIRDFGKEIWFFGAWLVIGWLLRRGQPHASPAIYVPACVAGAVLGLGLGFRVDLMIIIPAVISVILFAVRGVTRAALTTKAIAAGGFIITFALTGAPILTTLYSEASLSHAVVLGLMTPFNDALGIDPPVYDVGDLYADGFAASVIEAHAILVDRDRSPGRAGAPSYGAAYSRKGNSLLMDIGRRFPADFLVRALGATRQVIANPFDALSGAEAAGIDALTRTPMRLTLLHWRAVAGRWLHGHELLFIAAAFLAVALRDRRLSVVVTLLVLYFSCYSMLQFSRRHTFHLDIIAVGLVLVAISGGVSLVAWLVRPRRGASSIGQAAARSARHVALGVLTGAVMVAIAAGAMTAARAWQQRRVTALFERALAAPLLDVPLTREPLPPVAAAEKSRAPWESMVAWRPLAWLNPVLLRPAPGAWPVAGAPAPLHAEYLVIEFGGARCKESVVPIMISYSSTVRSIDTNYTRAFDVPVTNGSRLLVPIIEIPGTSRFDGLVVSGDRAVCVHRVRRVDPPEVTPLPYVFAVLPANWRSTALYQRLTNIPAPSVYTPVIRPGDY
jgi:hypothetical protein